MAVQVTDQPDEQRYEARISDSSGDRLAGFAEYSRSAGRIAFTHTEVDPDFRGQGIADQLARTALDAARAGGLRVVPQCSYIAAWIERHPDYGDLV